MLICDPLGYPRWFAYNYGMQFVVLPDRVLQFFELGHTWRDIWTDGRKLPENPPQPRWLGYAVGRWEGDTFVVESTGYDDRAWLQEDRRDRRWGFPHSDQLRIVERYRRTSYTTLDAELTIIDPVVYTKPWTTKATIQLSAGNRALGISLRDVRVGSLQRAEAEGPGRREIEPPKRHKLPRLPIPNSQEDSGAWESSELR